MEKGIQVVYSVTETLWHVENTHTGQSMDLLPDTHLRMHILLRVPQHQHDRSQSLHQQRHG